MKKLIILSAIAMSGLMFNSADAQSRFHNYPNREQLNYANRGGYSHSANFNRESNQRFDNRRENGYSRASQYGGRNDKRFGYRGGNRYDHRINQYKGYERSDRGGYGHFAPGNEHEGFSGRRMSRF